MGGYFSSTANLGDTNKFFMPWLIPRNDRNSIFRPNFFGKLAGRTKREEILNGNSIETGIILLRFILLNNSREARFARHPLVIPQNTASIL